MAVFKFNFKNGGFSGSCLFKVASLLFQYSQAVGTALPSLQMGWQPGAAIDALGHRDKTTEAKERAAEQLSVLPSQQAELRTPEADFKAAAEQQDVRFPSPAVEARPQQDGAVSHEIGKDHYSHDQRQARASHLLLAAESEGRGQDAHEQESKMGHPPVQHVGQIQAKSDEEPPCMDLQHDLPQQNPTLSSLSGSDAARANCGDSSMEYYENAKQAIETIVHSVEQQTAILGLKTLLTILKVERTISPFHVVLPGVSV